MNDHRAHAAKLMSLAVHEFRTPVGVVSGYLRLLHRRFGETLTDQQRMLVEGAEQSCGTISGLLADLSDLAAMESGRAPMRRLSVRVFDLLSDVVARLPVDPERRVVVDVDGTVPGVVVSGDVDRLRLVLESVVSAVVRERADAATVLARCGVVPGDDGPLAVVAVGDPGQAAEFASRTALDLHFDLYRAGLGFRLPLAAAIVAAHGGRISSPVEDPGRLAIVLALPVMADPPGGA